ncbi:hypothetical protein BDW62DRAFT_40207 [Aspergillus aurantiobrunneus]
MEYPLAFDHNAHFIPYTTAEEGTSTGTGRSNPRQAPAGSVAPAVHRGIGGAIRGRSNRRHHLMDRVLVLFDHSLDMLLTLSEMRSQENEIRRHPRWVILLIHEPLVIQRFRLDFGNPEQESSPLTEDALHNLRLRDQRFENDLITVQHLFYDI